MDGTLDLLAVLQPGDAVQYRHGDVDRDLWLDGGFLGRDGDLMFIESLLSHEILTVDRVNVRMFGAESGSGWKSTESGREGESGGISEMEDDPSRVVSIISEDHTPIDATPSIVSAPAKRAPALAVSESKQSDVGEGDSDLFAAELEESKSDGGSPSKRKPLSAVQESVESIQQSSAVGLYSALMGSDDEDEDTVPQLLIEEEESKSAMDRSEEDEKNEDLKKKSMSDSGKSAWKEGDSDEWEQASDFVFGEYIRDVANTVPDLLENIDEFASQMDSLGVRSQASRSRALALLEVIKAEMAAEEARAGAASEVSRASEAPSAVISALSIADGMDVYKDESLLGCVRCGSIAEVSYEMYNLSVCSHRICLGCFRKTIDRWLKQQSRKIREYKSTLNKCRRSRKYRRKYERKHRSELRKMKEERSTESIPKRKQVWIVKPVISEACCPKCTAPILMSDVDLFWGSRLMVSEMRRVLEYDFDSLKRTVKKHSRDDSDDSSSDGSSDSSDSDSNSSSSDSDSSSSDDSSDSSSSSSMSSIDSDDSSDTRHRKKKKKKRKRKRRKARSKDSDDSDDGWSDDDDESDGLYHYCFNDALSEDDGDSVDLKKKTRFAVKNEDGRLVSIVCGGRILKSEVDGSHKRHQWKCPECASKNCLKCSKIHRRGSGMDSCKSFKIETRHWFLRQWQDGKRMKKQLKYAKKIKSKKKELRKKYRRSVRKGDVTSDEVRAMIKSDLDEYIEERHLYLSDPGSSEDSSDDRDMILTDEQKKVKKMAPSEKWTFNEVPLKLCEVECVLKFGERMDRLVKWQKMLKKDPSIARKRVGKLPLIKQWKRGHCCSVEVKKGSKEWKHVLSFVQDGRNIVKVERVQNRRLWKKYQKYSMKIASNKRKKLLEMWVWHGTRMTPSEQVWKNRGFDLSFSRVGGCLWYAMQNSYSMGGYQYMNPKTGLNEVFLAVVAGGDDNDVKIIRGNILNVYRNEATYPAYVVSFR